VLALETYLRELRDIRSLGAAGEETAYYPALATLLTEVGKKLKPKVRCVMGLKDLGAGFPDGGLFTEEQFDKKHTLKPLPGQLPSRGVIEVKPVKKDAWFTAEGEQVSRYWGKYRQVLVTNYRDFLLVGQDAEGKAAKLEPFHLAESEKAFWAAAATPHALAQKVGGRFEEYLLRVMRHAAQLAAPEDVAWFLASYARDAKKRIEGVELPALATVRSALEEALGLKFEGAKGEHFFRSSLVQTLFYGVFSAWVLWAKQHSQVGSGGFIPPQNNGGVKPPLHATPPPRFDWYTTARYLRVPMISKLFHLVADPQELEALKLTEVLDWATLVLNRVDRRSFFDKFQESHAVQYFYEPFLEAFDPELRKELGVWYTPPEVVKYMVERVDTVLRQELGLPLGLADKNVYVLDPCCGTGSYLVEVLDRIHRTLKERGEDALLASDLKEAAQKRVFGFEILPAPFVVSHLQLGLLLQNLGAPLSEKGHERVRVYLTNALTGWEPPTGPKKQLVFKEMEEEREAAEHVKRDVEILVILGNPPYNAFAGVSPEEEKGLVEPYKEGLISEWGIKKFNLDDLYVRFLRLAERRIAEMTGRGVICYISNFSYLGDPSFVVMRKRFLGEFDKLWFDCMNGDSRETGKLTPDGKPDPSVFSTKHNPQGIRVGTTIGLMVRSEKHTTGPSLGFRHFWGVTKRADLLASLGLADFDAQYRPARPAKANRYSFRPEKVTSSYLSWPALVELASRQPFAGVSEDRRKALISIDPDPLSARLKMYFDKEVEWSDLQALGTGLTRDVPRFKAKKARAILLEAEKEFDEKRLLRYAMRPFDLQRCYYSPVRPLWREPRPEYWAMYQVGSPVLVSRFKAAKSPEGPPIAFARSLCDYHMMPPNASVFPFILRAFLTASEVNATRQGKLAIREPEDSAKLVPNVSAAVRAYLQKLGMGTGDDDVATAGVVWMHALAIGYSPAYLSENADGIRQDWPRIPLPDSKELLLASAEVGKQIAALLDTETPFDVGARHGVPLQRIAAPSRVGGGSLSDDELAVTAGWGHAGKGGVTMPGKGKIVERDYTAAERSTAVSAVSAGEDARATILGDRTLDVYLNDVAYWSNIPIRVWEYTIGGYQVIKKWLSYREEKLLGRSLTKEEVRYVQEMARRIAAVLLLEPALDANYRSIKEHAYTWTA
jgi:hypothetical protein